MALRVSRLDELPRELRAKLKGGDTGGRNSSPKVTLDHSGRWRCHQCGDLLEGANFDSAVGKHSRDHGHHRFELIL
ncbi:MAG: hypothetical protein GY929_09065 [Actinomycetia bacterium]|nr:hypothetical protein [Actinomycetes bacterium]